LSRRIRAKAVAAVAVIVGAIMLIGAPVSAAPSLTVSKTTELNDGDVVSVTASGFGPNALGGVTQCNDDPGQPTVEFFGQHLPVGCTAVANVVTFSPAGDLPATNLTLHTGTVGPPATGLDSNGDDAATSAADYPCPPTAAQIAAGVNCIIAVGDLSGSRATQVITFQGQAVPPTTTTTAAPTTTTAAGGATTTTAKATTTTAASSTATTVAGATTTTSKVLAAQATRGGTLPVTGPTRALILLAVIGFVVVDVGYLVESATHRPRHVVGRVRNRLRRGVMRRD